MVVCKHGRKDKKFYVTEKLDGSSVSVYVKDGEFGVCSRNMEFKRDEKNLDEELKSLEEVEAVRGTTMEDGVKLHKKPLWLQIKDVLLFFEE